jgi:hypothetical protein
MPLISDFETPHIKWAGGDSPKSLSEISASERALVSILFQERVSVWQEMNRARIPHYDARIIWLLARLDAHATMRAR